MVTLQIDGDRGRIIELKRFVVAVALYVFRNEDFLAEAGAFAIQDFDFKTSCSSCRIPHRGCRSTHRPPQASFHQIHPIHCFPNLVRSHTEGGKVVLRKPHRIQNDLRLVSDNKNVLRIDRL